MSLFKRSDSPYWWVKLCHNGQRLQRSAGTSDRRKAQEYHDKLKAQLWDEAKLGAKPSYVWEEAVVRWTRESSHKATICTDKIHLRWLHPDLAGMKLADIRRDTAEKLIERGKAEGSSNATVNRRLETLRSILRKAAYEWEWLDKAPKIRMLKEPLLRVRFLSREEATCLLSALPPHLRAMARFSLATGLRQANVKQLQWSQVDLEARRAWIHPDQAKARKAIPVPLTDAALDVLNEERGKHPEYVFTYRGNPIRQVGTKAWRGALERAGILNFRWHDLRHTWASWSVQAGMPLHVLQELGGWQTTEMVKRYAHLSVEHLGAFADRFSEQTGLRGLLRSYKELQLGYAIGGAALSRQT